MQTRRGMVSVAVMGVWALTGLTHIPAAYAQDEPIRKAKVIIQTPEGQKEFDVDPNQLPDLATGSQVIVAQIGPDGQILSYDGDPNMLKMLNSFGIFNGTNGFKRTGANGLPLMGGQDVIDPGRSYLAQLLKREDVRSHLGITLRQRWALDDVEKSQQANMEQQIKQSVHLLSDDLKDKTLSDILGIAETHVAKMSEQMQGLTSEADNKLLSLLTPPQRKRLEELDKQWRGPLAIGAKDVAPQMKLTAEQAPVVTDLLQQYRKEVNNRFNFNSPPAQKTQSLPKDSEAAADLSPQERQAKIVQIYKEIEKARQSLGQKALKGLSPEQRTQWSAIIGKPFMFRTD